MRAVGDRPVECSGIAGCDPDRRMRLLPGLRHGCRERKTPVSAFMRVIAGPELLHGRQQLLHEGDALLLRNAAGHAVEFVLERTAPDTQLQSSAGQVIAKSSLAGETD